MRKNNTNIDESINRLTILKRAFYLHLDRIITTIFSSKNQEQRIHNWRFGLEKERQICLRYKDCEKKKGYKDFGLTWYQSKTQYYPELKTIQETWIRTIKYLMPQNQGLLHHFQLHCLRNSLLTLFFFC